MKSKWMSGLLLVAIGFSFTQVMVHAGETADTEGKHSTLRHAIKHDDDKKDPQGSFLFQLPFFYGQHRRSACHQRICMSDFLRFFQ